MVNAKLPTVPNEEHRVRRGLLGVTEVGGGAPGQGKDESGGTETAEVDGGEETALGRPGEGNHHDTRDDVRDEVARADDASGVGHFPGHVVSIGGDSANQSRVEDRDPDPDSLDDKGARVDGNDFDGARDHAEEGGLADGEAKGVCPGQPESTARKYRALAPYSLMIMAD